MRHQNTLAQYLYSQLSEHTTLDQQFVFRTCLESRNESSRTANKVTKSVYLYNTIPPKVKKSKVIPLHAMEAHGRRGGIAPTHT
jgi:hypothetical protein